MTGGRRWELAMSQVVLLNSLSRVRRRVRLLSAVHGVGLSIAAAVGLLVAVVLLDYLFNLPPVPRLINSVLALGLLGYVAMRTLIRPMTARLGLGDVAGKIEQTFPHFDDRLRSTVDFVSHPTDGSDAMKQRVVDQATSLASDMDLAAVVQPRPAWAALGLGTLAITIALALAIAIGPDYLSVAMGRLFTPFDGRPWPKRTLIELVGSTPLRIAAGTSLDVQMRLAKGDRRTAKALIYYQYGSTGPIEQELMTRNLDGSYTASLDTRLESGRAQDVMNVWMHSGDDEKHLPPVQVVPPLEIRQVQAVVTPPKYADLPPATFDLAAGAATVTTASSLELRIDFSKPLASGNTIRLEPVGTDGAAPPLQWQANTGQSATAVGRFVARQPAHFRIIATDQDGFSNSGIEEYQILVRPDQIPSVQFEKPVRNLDCTPDATIPIEGIAEDDFGIKILQFASRRLSDNKSWMTNLVDNATPIGPEVGWHKLDSTTGLVRYAATWDWQLADVKPGDQLEFYLRVQDNYQDDQGRPHDPPFSESGHLRVTIISADELTRQLGEQLSQLRSEVDQTRKANESLRVGTRSLQQDTQNKPSLDRADKAAAANLADDQSAAAGQAKQIADRLGEMLQRMQQNKLASTPMAANVADAQKLLNDASETGMKDAAEKLADLSQQKSAPPAQRNPALDQAQQSQANASSQLQAAMDKMGQDAGVSQFLKQVAELLEAQKNLSNQTAQAGKSMLGKDPSQLSDDEKKTLNDIASRQDELSKQTDRAVEGMKQAAQNQTHSDPSTSQALQQAAQTAQQQNVSGQMNQAAQAAGQNQQASAQTAQQQAELGLMMMVRQLQEAENRHLMELVKQLETAQQLVADLLQQQASHNLDNLMLQGPAALTDAIKASPELIADLIDYSQRDAQHLPPPLPLDTQIALQAQTERNTRNTVPTIQALPEGAEPAAELTRAAQRMSRAISYLQDAQLTDAYQPPQVEAFAALLSAKQILDKQAAAARQKVQDQQRESLRQQFVSIRSDQVKINTQTKTIDSAPRNPEGQLDHQARVNLALLSDQQSALAKRTAKLDDDLVAIGSIAYTYANDQIVTQMDGVTTSLSKLDPAQKTQQHQQRIVRELDNMIKDLAIKPKQSPFSNPRNGGSGQGQGKSAPRLPPEAEIRLIQDMQRLLNDDTKDADAQAVPDKPAILDLGKRQGDLRKLLDDLLKKSSRGQTTLGPEPTNKPTLPEEVTDEDLDLQELKDAALNAKPDSQGIQDDTATLGIRMSRARQRLALDADPGTTTQKIQDRIVIQMDALAKMAQEQEATANPSAQPGQGQPRPAGPGQQQLGPDNSLVNGQRDTGPKGGSTPAPNDRNAGPGLTDQDISASLNQLKDSWGKLSPRQRAAVLEGSTDQTIQKFKDYVDGYYRTLAEKATQQQ